MCTYLSSQPDDAAYRLEDVYFALVLHPFHDAYYAKRCKEVGVQTVSARAKKSLLLEWDVGKAERSASAASVTDARRHVGVLEAEGSAKKEISAARVGPTRAVGGKKKRGLPKLRSKRIAQIQAEARKRRRNPQRESTAKRARTSLVGEEPAKRVKKNLVGGLEEGSSRKDDLAKKPKKSLVQVRAELQKQLNRSRKEQLATAPVAGERVNAFRRVHVEKERRARAVRKERLREWTGQAPETETKEQKPSSNIAAGGPASATQDSMRTVTSSGRTQSAAGR